MPRFITNRWWTFILALVFGLGLLVVQPARQSFADIASGGQMGTGDIPGGGLPPPGNGDPDLPLRVKRAETGGIVKSAPGVYSMRAAGDSPVTDSALMWRLQVVLRALKGFCLHL